MSNVKKIFDSEQIDWWNDLTDEEKAEIDLGVYQASNTILKSNKEVMNIFDKWH